jgi:hypothetical protein
MHLHLRHLIERDGKCCGAGAAVDQPTGGAGQGLLGMRLQVAEEDAGVSLGNPQALLDILENAGKERVIDKAYSREEARHDAGERYITLAPLLLVLLACLGA